MDKETDKIIISRDVTFLEGKQKQEEIDEERKSEDEAEIKITHKEECTTTEEESEEDEKAQMERKKQSIKEYNGYRYNGDTGKKIKKKK